MLDAIKNRRACRAFKSDMEKEEKIKEIVDAGLLAPSGMNRQICSILAIRRNSLVNKLRELGQEYANRDCYYGASTIVLVYGPREAVFTKVDSACILENIFIAAEALGISSCWINQSDEILNTPNGKKLRKKLGLTEDDYVVGSAILGYGDGEKPQPKAKREDLVRII